ncbi:MAG: 5-bromo-4-chloroindolyl phosphate hydrolysis family protein [Tenericutes bacterium]|nr:5-bromo-4-chloroindolyl phosphate hydrolysis family protein [Mycoplasmatota bacterium]
MKHKDTISAFIGSAFFAVPYLALSLPILPSVLIGASAFVAGELILTKNKKTLKEENFNLYKVLENAKKQNKRIIEAKSYINNYEIKAYLTSINESTSKIIKAIEKTPKKIKNIDNFFDYYLPITVKIINRYDEIENNDLSSKDSKKFMSSTINMLSSIDKAFKNILNSLYQKEIIDMSAEMKVFSSMLKADGFNENELEVKEDNNG